MAGRVSRRGGSQGCQPFAGARGGGWDACAGRGEEDGRRRGILNVNARSGIPEQGGGCVTPPGATGASEADPHQFWHSRRRLRAVRAIPGTCGLPSADAMSNGLMPERPSMNHCNLGRASSQLRSRKTSPTVDHDRGRPGRKADTLEDNWRVSPKATRARVAACATMWPRRKDAAWPSGHSTARGGCSKGVQRYSLGRASRG